MAMNLTPRPYNIDPTGRDYVLDPAPLLRAQEKNFHTQNETMNMVYETGRKGMEFVEYLGARQQLGRVKAQLSELDPNDPEFSRRLSALILDNPLALENPNTAPALKLAIAPLAAAAQAARKHQYDLEEITASYGGRVGLQAARVQGQMDVLQNKRDNTPLTPEQQAGLAPIPERVPITDSRPAAQGTASGEVIPFGVNSPDPDLFPQTATGENSQDSNLLPGESNFVGPPSPTSTPVRRAEPVPETSDITDGGSGDLGTGQAEAVAIHQAANEAAAAQAPAALPAGFKRAKNGAVYKETHPGKWDMVPPAVPKPTEAPASGKYHAISKKNELGQPTAWEEAPLVKRTGEERDALDKRIIGQLSVNQQLMATESDMTGKKAKADRLKDHLDSLVSVKADDTATRAEWETAQQEWVTAVNTHKQLDAILRDNARMKLDPEYAKEVQEMRAAEQAVADQQYAAAFNDFLLGGDMLAETPGAATQAAAAPAPQSVADQFRVQEPQAVAQDERWTSEKVFALNEAKSLALRLGLTEDALIDAVKSKDKKALSLIVRTAAERGVTSPLLFVDPDASTPVWGRSKVGQSYLDVLRKAVTDESLVGITAEGTTKKSKKWEASPFQPDAK